jgi:hypothetical protein
MSRIIVQDLYLSYDDWRELFYRAVKKGEKARAQTADGKAMFSLDQTRPLDDSDYGENCGPDEGDGWDT